MISLFDRELIEMEREVRDLKTIHQRGLGATRFYKKSFTKTGASSGYHNFRVQIYDGEPMPAIITAYINTPTPTRTPTVEVSPQSYGASVSVYCYTAGNIRVDVVSSSDIQGITAT